MFRGFVYVLKGAGRLGATTRPVTAAQVAWFDPSAGDGNDTLHDCVRRTRPLGVLLCAGPPIKEPVAFGGPFVMNTAEEIRQAFVDYRTRKFSRMNQ